MIDANKPDLTKASSAADNAKLACSKVSSDMTSKVSVAFSSQYCLQRVKNHSQSLISLFGMNSIKKTAISICCKVVTRAKKTIDEFRVRLEDCNLPSRILRYSYCRVQTMTEQFSGLVALNVWSCRLPITSGELIGNFGTRLIKHI